MGQQRESVMDLVDHAEHDRGIRSIEFGNEA